MKSNKIIYLDNQSTTPLDPNVLESMMPYLTSSFGNPASNSHILGWEAAEAIEIAREDISKLINSNTNEIIFTSGATESINLALKGLFSLKNNATHIITTNIEHTAVNDVLNFLKNQNIDISYLPVDKDGLINLKQFEKEINKNTCLCTVIHGNNEIGSIQPIKKIGAICKKNNIIFHVDASQTLGKINIDVEDMNIDLLSISSHKIYGPKGIGALYLKRKNPRIELAPLFHGGGHERGLRSGTLAPHNIVGFGTACLIAKNEVHLNKIKIKAMTDRLLNGLRKLFPKLIVNGSLTERIDGNLNITFPKHSAEQLMMKMTEIACSTGSACTSSIPKPSHVLLAIGLNKEQINNTIRFGIGKFNTLEEIDNVINLFEQKIIGA
jgi:cysteine desulfurase